MYQAHLPLAPLAADLRSGERDLLATIDAACERIEQVEPIIQALLPEPARRARLYQEAEALQARYPDAAHRPPLYGILVGVKDIFRTAGFPTHAGSNLPPDLFEGPEAAVVTALRAAGALILGKTVTTEFAFFEPGPTRNPHNPDHTPGGSSSGSAAAVAAGFCPLAVGTQTIGSVIRPAAFCGIVGFKPTYNRIDPAGLLFFSRSLDHVGLFTQDVAGMTLAAGALCTGWAADRPSALPILGVPDGPYLDQATPEALTAFEAQLERLQAAGVTVRRLPAFDELPETMSRHRTIAAGEIGREHRTWFEAHGSLYRPRTSAIIQEGLNITDAALDAARAGQGPFRASVEATMQAAGIDLWVAPAAPGPAPEGIGATGDPAMNLPWTQAGMPSLTLPAGRAANGLPLGLQLVAASNQDEALLGWGEMLEGLLAHA